MRISTASILLTLLTLVFMGCGGGSAEKQAETEQESEVVLKPSGRSLYFEDKGLASPESIIRYENTYYVANVGKKLLPSEKDGDGFISMIDAEGIAQEEPFAKELDAPKGMVIVDGTLYVADVDKVKGYNLASGEMTAEIDFSSKGTGFLNDLALKDGNEIFVSATDINKVFTLTVPDGEPQEIITMPTIQKPNGLAYDKDNDLLYVSTFAPEAKGVIGVIEKKGNQNTFKTLSGAYVGSLDGIALLGDYIVFSDWNRQVLLLLVKETGQVAQYPVPLPSSQIKGPADLYLDLEGGEIWVPGMEENTITVVSLPQ